MAAKWPIKDRADDMERGYSINKTACNNTKEKIESKETKDSK